MNPNFAQHMSSQGQQPQVPQPPALFNNQAPQQQQPNQQQQQQRGPPMMGMNINMNMPQAAAAQQQSRASPTTNASPSQATFGGARHPPYQPPSTPAEAARERERVALLLEINSLLLHHASKLQSSNQGGVMPQPGQPSADKHPTPEYVSYLRAIQANIAFCATVETKGKQNRGGQTLPGPAMMDAPNGATEDLLKMYEKLREIFPGWRGVMKPSMVGGVPGGPGQQQQGPAQAQAQMQAMQQQRQQQMGQQAQGQMQGMGGPMGQQQQPGGVGMNQQQQQGGMPFGSQMPMGMMSMQMGQLPGQQQQNQGGGQNQQWMAGQAG